MLNLLFSSAENILYFWLPYTFYWRIFSLFPHTLFLKFGRHWAVHLTSVHIVSYFKLLVQYSYQSTVCVHRCTHSLTQSHLILYHVPVASRLSCNAKHSMGDVASLLAISYGVGVLKAGPGWHVSFPYVPVLEWPTPFGRISTRLPGKWHDLRPLSPSSHNYLPFLPVIFHALLSPTQIGAYPLSY